MKLFIDSADVAEIKDCVEQGIIDGVTTNPSLVAKAGRKFKDVLLEICEMIKGPVNAEVVSLKKDDMMREAREYSRLASNIVVKLPLVPEGLKAVRQCKSEGIRTNVTLCFSAPQALLAAKAGASYVSPFVGRLDDIASVGMELVRQIVTIYKNYGFATEVLVASVRNPNHLVEAALCGAHVATLPYGVIQQLVRHPLTDVGLQKFLADWEKVPR